VTESQSEAAGGERDADSKRRLKLSGGVGTVAAIVAAVGGLVALLFQVDPGLAPCLGSRQASFTGAPVFPHYSYKQYLSDIGRNPSGYPNPYGVEIRYSYQANDLRGHLLVLRATLVRVGRSGEIIATYTSPTANENLRPVTDFTPEHCSQGSGNAFFVLVPPEARGRLEIILELFNGPGRQDRVALGQTPSFQG
jgi:hypothetical protein